MVGCASTMVWFSTFVTMVYQAQNSVVDHGQSDNDGFSTFVNMVLHLTMVDILMVFLNVFPSTPSNIFFWLHQIYQVNIIIYNQLVNDSYINLALYTFCGLEIDQYYKDMQCLAIISEDIILQKHRRLLSEHCKHQRFNLDSLQPSVSLPSQGLICLNFIRFQTTTLSLHQNNSFKGQKNQEKGQSLVIQYTLTLHSQG